MSTKGNAVKESIATASNNSSPSWSQISNRGHLFVAAIIGIVTVVCLMPCLNNTITVWDDTAYIRDDIFIKDLSWQGIKNIFSHPVMGNYHPITILWLAVEYSMVNMEPWLYHFDSLMLHMVVTLLVYWFVLRLSSKPVAAIVSSLLFAIHPMHVESVAWVSARKDLLVGLFYLAACIAYIKYVSSNKGYRWYTLVLLLFMLALLSKAVAVTLPLTLLLIDYFENGKVTGKDVLAKLPHLLLAIIFGVVSLKVQAAAGAMEMQKVVYGPLERMALGSYAFVTYLWKAVVPTNLHNFYPYPPKVDGALPVYYYGYLLAVVAVGVVFVRYARRSKVVLFGGVFFIINIALILQFLPVGESIVAERYSYLPYLGLFFMAGWWVAKSLEGGAGNRRRIVAIALAGVYIAVLGFVSNARCAVWYDELSLWSDEVIKEPVQAPQAWSNLGYLYSIKWGGAQDIAEKQNYYDSAVYLMNKAIVLKPDFLNPYIGLGDLLRNAGKVEEAKAVFRKAFIMKPMESNLALELAICYYVAKDMDSAGIYFRKEVELDTTAVACGNYANYLEGLNRNDSALVQFNNAIERSNTNYIVYANRGKLYKKMNRWGEAKADFETAIRMNPDVGELYYLKSFCDTQRHDRTAALRNVEKAISLGFTAVNKEYCEELKKAK